MICYYPMCIALLILKVYSYDASRRSPTRCILLLLCFGCGSCPRRRIYAFHKAVLVQDHDHSLLGWAFEGVCSVLEFVHSLDDWLQLSGLANLAQFVERRPRVLIRIWEPVTNVLFPEINDRFQPSWSKVYSTRTHFSLLLKMARSDFFHCARAVGTERASPTVVTAQRISSASGGQHDGLAYQNNRCCVRSSCQHCISFGLRPYRA